MSAKGALIGMGAVFVLAYSWGYHTAGEPETVYKTQTIRIPEVITHVETKEVDHPKPMPDSCKYVVDKVATITGDLESLDGAAGEIHDQFGEAAIAAATHDIGMANKIMTEYNKQLAIMDGSAMSLESLQHEIKPWVDSCKKDSQPTER